MKYIYVIVFFCVSLHSAITGASDSEPVNPLSAQEKSLKKTCNLEARNSLINGDIALVEKVCTRAIEELDKAHAYKEHLIDPILNMAFAYTLAGQFEKATPLYKRARGIREKIFGPGSREVKQVDALIKEQETMQGKNR